MIRLVALLLCGLALSGCATVTRGTDEQVAFDTTPPGAEVRAVVEDNRATDTDTYRAPTNTMACVTPCTLKVRRVDKMAITISKSGFETEEFQLIPSVSATGAMGAAGNAIIGGVGGLIIDSATGAGLDKCPNPVRLDLRPLPGPRGRPVMATRYDPVAACRAQAAANQKAADPGLRPQNPAM